MYCHRSSKKFLYKICMHFWKYYSEYTCQFTTQQPMTVSIISLYTIMRERSPYVVYFIFLFCSQCKERSRKVQNYMNFVGVVGNPPRCSLWHLLISDLNFIMVSLAIFTLSFKSTISAWTFFLASFTVARFLARFSSKSVLCLYACKVNGLVVVSNVCMYCVGS